MDKKTRDFFEEVVKKEGSPVFEGKMPPKDSEFWLASKVRAFWNFLIGNGKSKKHKTEVAQVQETVSTPKEEPKQTEVSEGAKSTTTPTEQEEPQEFKEPQEEEKLIETFEKAHPEEAGKTQLSK